MLIETLPYSVQRVVLQDNTPSMVWWGLTWGWGVGGTAERVSEGDGRETPYDGRSSRDVEDVVAVKGGPGRVAADKS